MFNLICKLFISNYENTNEPSVRERYGVVFSIFAIICNIILVIFKLIVSFITNSVSIRADAFNNLSDVGSNIAALFGFVLANKHSDSDHPYGHGRMEYVSGMIVSFLILYMGIQAFIDAIKSVINPGDIQYSSVALIVLIVSIAIKLIMAIENKKAGKKINSDTLFAASQDSFNDSIMTFSTLVSLLIYKLTDINLDAYIGAVVSIFVLKAGIEIFKNVMDTILGKAPDVELIKKIEALIMSHDYVLGIHDLILHDYGHSHQFMSLHAEVDANVDVIELHDMIDNIENDILNEYNILTTIHMDPINTKDELANELKVEVKKIVLDINPNYNMHDFRIVRGPTHTNLVFDVLVPADETKEHEEIKKQISNKVKEMDGTYYCVIQIDHSFV